LTALVRLRRLRRFTGLGVDARAALGVVGVLIKWLSLASLFPTAIAIGYSEPFWPFLAAGGIAAAVGRGLEQLGRGRDQQAGLREAFLIVASTWLLAAGFGALPYVFIAKAPLGQPLNAYFEAMSGFTTTGSSVVADPSELAHSVLMWRQFTQWLGGMGIIVLAIAVLPRLRVGGRQLLEHELPGPEVESLTTSIRATAQRLWLLYVALTGALALTLSVFAWTGVDDRMSIYDAVAHALTTMPTGGFSTSAKSLGAFGPASQWAIIVFMVLAGTNFALLYRAFVRRRPQALRRDDEFRVYLLLLMVGASILVAELLSEDIFGGESAVRHAVLQSVSIMTTTGYANADFTTWTALTAMTILALMFVGGSAGSTGGGPKVVRHLMIGKTLRRDLYQLIHPEAVVPIRLNRTPVDERTLRAVITFVLLYIGIFVLGAAGLAIDSARLNAHLSPFGALTAAATTLGNVGPAFGFAGPFGSFEPFSDLSKVILIGLMWLGRLEILPIVVLLTRGYWRA
jgi:trk system potassium uptake protein TrkH